MLSGPEPTIALRKAKRFCIYPIASYVCYDQLLSLTCSFVKSLNFVLIPNTIRATLTHFRWHSGMIEEVNTLDDNVTWDLVSLPTRKKTIRRKWVFAIRVNPKD